MFEGKTAPAIRVGARIKDNDPRVPFERVLTVIVVEQDHVRAQDPSGREVRVQTRRIHAAGKARRSGFTLLTESRSRG